MLIKSEDCALYRALSFLVYAKITRSVMRNIEMFGGLFMSIKILGIIISLAGAALSLADQSIKDKKMEELIKKEVDKQLNKK